MTPQVTLELRTARDNEAGPQAAAAVFSALPNQPALLKRLFSEVPTFTFEWLNQGQTTYALLTLPQQYQEYITGQLVANYPEILIQPLAHNPLEEFNKGLPQAWGELRLNSPTYHSLKTYSEFTDIDPLSGVLSALAKLLTGEVALIQFTVRKATEKWKAAGYSAISPSTSTEGAPKMQHPHAESIRRKLSDTGYEVAIHIVVQAPEKLRAKHLLESIATAFNAVQSQAAELRLRTPLLARKRLEKVLTRTVNPTNQYLSSGELATLYHLPNKTLSSVRGLAWGKTLRGEPPHNLPIYANIEEEKRDELNLFARTEFKNQSQIFGIQREDRRRHMYVVGKSGTGKSTLLANMIINDLKHDEGIAVIDPHGDLVETVLNYIPKRRINDVIVIDPSDPNAVVRMNLFEGGSTVHRELVASGIVSIFQKLYGHTWGPRLEYVLRNALLTLLQHNAKLSDVLRILTDKKYRDRIVDATDDPVLQNFWRAEFDRLNDKQRVEAISPILNKVGQFVTSPLIRRMVDAEKSSFDIEEAMNSGKIILMNLSQGKIGEDNAALLGAMMITKIQLAAMNRVYMDEKDRKDFFLYIDEFQNFATTSFVKILSEARKYHLSLILANQYVAQIPEEVQAAIFGNAGNLVSFIVGASDGAILQREFADKYSIEDLVSLGRYQIVTRLLIDGHMSLPFPAHTLGLASSVNQNREKVLKVSRERYARVNT
jgi:hypothetical protein